MRAKVALVTGATRGIGRQIALSMAQAGYDVVVNYRGDKGAGEMLCQEIEAMGRKSLAVYADMGKDRKSVV